LHTNFKLSSLGESLALLMPDSQTVEAEYVPNYPAQALDVSFGQLNGAGAVDGADRDPQWRTQNGTAWSYTKGADFNLDGGIAALDLNLFWRPNLSRINQVPANVTQNAAFNSNKDTRPSTKDTR